MNVRLVAITKPVVEGVETADQLLAYCARVSNPSNQLNTETADRLISYCIRNKHWSIFEQAGMTVEITTSRAIAAQILRHRSFTFQEFCITGDSLITFELPRGIKNKRRGSKSIRIDELFDKWTNGARPVPSKLGKSPVRIPMQDRMRKMLIRTYDETSKTFVAANLSDVFQTGLKKVFEIELFNGKKIKCTKEHKFLTERGFIPLEEAIGLEIIGDTAVMSLPDTALACNGMPVYQSFEWMKEAKQNSIETGGGVQQIADEAGVSYHTIRKWLKIHKLQFTKREVSQYTPIWNKGKTGYRLRPHSLETRKKMSESAKKGADSNLWRGGVMRSERQKIGDWCALHRSEFLEKFQYKCARCGSNKSLEMHHIMPVYSHPELAYEKENIEVLCEECHDEHHGMGVDKKIWRERSVGNALTLRWSKVKSVRYVGEEMTYDLEIDHPSHNYVANGIVVHNSQRYASALGLEKLEWRAQGKTNRQVGDEPVSLSIDLQAAVSAAQNMSIQAYEELVKAGIAKECARMILPLNTSTRLYMNGSVRSWIHYLEIRQDSHAQKEHRDIADAIRVIFNQQFPMVASALESAKVRDKDQAHS